MTFTVIEGGLTVASKSGTIDPDNPKLKQSFPNEKFVVVLRAHGDATGANLVARYKLDEIDPSMQIRVDAEVSQGSGPGAVGVIAEFSSTF